MPKTLQLTEDQITDIKKRIQQDRVAARSEASEWRGRIPLQRRLAKGGPNPDRVENLPWEGAANEHLGVIGDSVDEITARVMNTFFGDLRWAPITPVSGMQQDRVQDLEDFMQWGLQVDIKIWGLMRSTVQEACTVGNAFVFAPWERKKRTTRETRYLAMKPGVSTMLVEGLEVTDEQILELVFGTELLDSYKDYETEPTQDPSSFQGPRQSGWSVVIEEGGRRVDAKVYIDREPLDRMRQIEVVVEREEIVRDCPAPRLLDPERFDFVDVGDFAESPFYHIEFDVTVDWLKRQKQLGFLNFITDEEIKKIEEHQPKLRLKSASGEGLNRAELDAQSGSDTATQASGTRPYILVFMRYDINDDGYDEEIIVDYDWHLNIIMGMCFLEERYPHGFRPVTEFKIFQVPNRVRSFGIPILLMDEQLIVNTLINQAIDAQTLRNTPFFLFDQAMGLGDRLRVDIQPGQGFGVPGFTREAFMPITLSGQGIDTLLPLIDTIIGFMNQRVGRISMAGGRTVKGGGASTGTPRTFGGQNMVLQDNLVRLELLLKTLAFGGEGRSGGLNELYHQIMSLYAAFMPESMKFKVTGKDEPKVVTRADLRNRVDFMFGVNILSANYAVRRADAMTVWQNTGPVLAQLGAMDQWIESLRRFHSAFGTPNPEAVIPQRTDMFNRAPMDPELENFVLIHGHPLDPHPLDDPIEHLQVMQEFMDQHERDYSQEQWTEFIRHFKLTIEQAQSQRDAGTGQFNTGGRPVGTGAVPVQQMTQQPGGR